MFMYIIFNSKYDRVKTVDLQIQMECFVSAPLGRTRNQNENMKGGESHRFSRFMLP